MTARVARGAWLAYAAIAGMMVLFAVLRWGQALVSVGPVLYGEGAVAHAAILMRTLAPYADAGGATFTAANYPPVYFLLASVGDPFVTGRALSVIATVGIAALLVWRARSGGPLVAGALGLGWLGSGFMFAALFAVPAVLHWGFRLNAIAAFWFAYIVTRPLGASFADWMGVSHARGGLDLGAGPVSLALAALIVGCVIYLSLAPSATDNTG